VAMVFNYLGYHSVLVDLAIGASLVITVVSALHYIWHARRIIDATGEK
jgi:heme exporter protein D